MNEARSEAGVSQTVKASEFKARCLKLMDEVAASGKEIVITKNGRPVSPAGAVPKQAESAIRTGPGQDSDTG